MKGPGGKYIFGTVKVGEKGQIVIPKEARDVFHIKPGDSLLLLGDEERGGIAIIKKTDNIIKLFMDGMMEAMGRTEEIKEIDMEEDLFIKAKESLEDKK